ncbi:MAG: SMI1/KNR4 family protein [Ruminococcus sp.]|nr:SMI1/KNR4 family protein [Ruminococcus sp.]
MFENFDFSDFWRDSEYALDEYVGESPTDEYIESIEKELGYKLPESYKYLIKQHNGGMPKNTAFRTNIPTSWSKDHISIEGIYGVDRKGDNSVCGETGTEFWIDEWEYPAIGVAICDTPSAGHEMVFLDYRECGKDGEPKVVYNEQDNDMRIVPLADTFEEFIRGLISEDEFDYE